MTYQKTFQLLAGLTPRLPSLLESKGEVIIPVDWQTTKEDLNWTRPGHLYRGMTEVEFQAHRRAGYIQSTGRYSHSSEGTNFDDSAESAISYVNFGRDDTRKTGRPNYVIEVKRNDALIPQDRRDYYFKAPDPIPWKLVTRAWKLVGENGAVVAYPLHV